MNEIILLLLAVVGVFSITCSVALIALGKMIDQFPLGDEATRTRGITSPVESTKLGVALFWGLFVPGAWAVLQDGIVTVIAGITILFSICLFMFTAMVFSFAVLSTMKGRKKAYGDTVLRVGAPASSAEPSSPLAAREQATIPKPQKNPLSNVLVHALLKK
jgi:hypothetical protein